MWFDCVNMFEVITLCIPLTATNDGVVCFLMDISPVRNYTNLTSASFRIILMFSLKDGAIWSNCCSTTVVLKAFIVLLCVWWGVINL